jgi:hypothetical protein
MLVMPGDTSQGGDREKNCHTRGYFEERRPGIPVMPDLIRHLNNMIRKNKDDCHSLGYFEGETAGNLRFS